MKNRTGKLTAIILCSIIAVSCMSACGGNDNDKKGTKKHIVATIFPEYDWAKEIVVLGKNDTELTLLLSNGVDMHSYQPSVDDIMTISTCDMFIYVGGESDGWVRDALAQASNKDMIVIDLMSVLGDRAKEEELVSGMETEHGDEENGSDEKEYDEHVWMSLENAELFCDHITEGLVKLDGAHAEEYKRNCGTYKDKLEKLKGEYKKTADASQERTIIVGDRFPYKYLTDEFGIKYYAAFPGCSAETDASFETIVFLAGKADEVGARAIIKTEASDGSVAMTVRDNTATKDQEILTLDSLQSVSAKDIDAGTSYYSVMEKNLDVLKRAL